MALIGIPRQKPARWINPDHVSSLVPRPTPREGGVELIVDMKSSGSRSNICTSAITGTAPR